jgi:SNF2 family DNA/RNA helicase
LLEKITGKGLDNSTSDLPKFIIEKVNQVHINENQLKVTMRPYQEFGAKFLLYQKNILLGDEMGLGKTIQALAVANHLFQEHQRKCMILLPLSVLENWNKEILKWTELPVYRFSASNKNKINDFIKWKQEGGILLANYEQAKYLIQGVDGVQIDLLILDEAHYIKNADAMRTKNSIALAQRANYKLFMTGTPLENNVREMQHLVSVLNPDLPESVFRERPDEEDFKKDLANVYLRRKREEVLDELPEMEVINLWSEFSDKQIELYETEAFSEGCSVMKLRRMAFLGEESEKIKQIIDICKEARENGMKVLIFSYFKTDVLYRLRELLTYTASDILSGDISPARRQEVIDEFSKDSNQTVLLAQIEAGGVGLNIQSANIVILCEPQWKPSTEQQAISRVYRMGQTRDVLVYRLLTKDSIDEPIMALIHKKEVEFDKYAKDSLVADAFVASEKMTEKEVQSKIIEIERNRISARKKNIA